MKRIYLTGQRTFGNRGCEAIVRSTVSVLRNVCGDMEVLVPSDNLARDSFQWPEAPNSGVKFVPAYLPPYTHPWVHTQRLPIPFLKQAGWPFAFPRWLMEQISSVDAVLSVGGDNYSLDYRLPSLLQGMDSLAMCLGKPVFIWGASVGPFEREPYFVSAIRQHLARVNRILVRESVSYNYLTNTHGLHNVTKMVDPAFILIPQAVDCAPFWPEDRGNGVVGLNISPLIERYKKSGQNIVKEVSSFIRTVVQEYGYGILLTPHVIPLDSGKKNNDAHYMKVILNMCRNLGPYVRMAPDDLNAAQLKHVISRQRFFIGARTHATIAALSSCVPTISIAYSVKARGINRDLFGHEEVVLNTQTVSSESLKKSLNYLHDNEAVLKQALSERIPSYRATLQSAAREIGGWLFE